MTVRVDYTQLDQPTETLRLEPEGDNWIAVGRDGNTVYFRSPDIEATVRFMRAFALRHDATLDEASIEYERMNRLHSVRVDRAWELAYGEGIDLADVIPLRRAKGL